MRHKLYRNVIKRFLDICISAAALVLLWPLCILIAVLIKLDSEGPVIFKQTRLGLAGKEFQMLKFRSMCVGAESGGVYSDDNDVRVTRMGKILRQTSLDELPQAINILRGEMSLIGPRPPLTYHPWPVEEYTADQLRMFEVRPGLTGWAQINGRREVEWHERILLNVWYVDHVSLQLDIKIFFVTIFKVFTNKNNSNVGDTVVTATEEKVSA